MEITRSVPAYRPLHQLDRSGFLVVYGSVYASLSTAVLTGVITVPGQVDRPGMLGHAALWDPLFAVWGATLVVGLWLTRTPHESDSADDPAPRSVPQGRAADAQEHRR